MIKEVVPGIFRLQIPLPRNPLRILNSYLIKGQDRHLLVDTGFDWPECKKALLGGLDTLGIALSQVDFFITHVHGDHCGLVYDLLTDSSKVYASEIDAKILRRTTTEEYWRVIDGIFEMHGFPPDKSKDPRDRVKGYISGSDIDITYVREGQLLKIGPYSLRCIMTPGHSPGHVCLYEGEKKFFISGDHILGDISPNITVWPETENSLGDYLDSLDKVGKMDISLILPGHRGLIYDHRQRIAELKKHHEIRLQEVRDILKKGAMTAYQVASFMSWDMSYSSWEEFPMFQRWFATGEAIAHLQYLWKLNQVKLSEKDMLLFSL